MTSAARIGRAADLLRSIGIHLSVGSGIAAFAFMTYGGRTGILGDAFVSFSDEFGANAAVLLFALMVLASLFGFMCLLYGAITVAVTVGGRIRTLAKSSRITR